LGVALHEAGNLLGKRRNDMSVYRRLFGFVAAAVAVVVLVGASAGDAWGSAKGEATCTGGSIASGIYSSLKIAGACAVDAGSAGSVIVQGNLTVLPGGSLVAVWGGVGQLPVSSNLTVGGNLEVQTGGLLNLGCEPLQFICANDPDQKVGSYSTQHTVGGNLRADNALAVVVHHTAIGGNASLNGGGGGVNSCTDFLPLIGAPPYGDFEDDVIGGNLTITGWLSCWLGWFRDTVMNNVDFDGNVSGDPDGSEMGSNTVLGNLNCYGNNPSPQIGDSMAGPTTVAGNANGQCVVQPGLVQH
jgi:hypothetical protein